MTAYPDWNRSLFYHFFNRENSREDVLFLNINRELLDSLDLDGYKNFINIFRLKGAKNFFRDFHDLIEISKKNSQRTIKAIPEYFGYLGFIILSLTEGEHESFSISNVYGRINEFAITNLGLEWKKIGNGNTLQILADAWKELEYWTSILNKGSSGFFKNYQNDSRRYADSIARHVVLNRRHLLNLLDILIDERIAPGEDLSDEQIRDLIKKNLIKIGATKALYSLLLDPGYSSILLKTIKNFINEYYTSTTYASSNSNKRTPPIILRLVVNKLPLFSNKVERIFLRAQSYLIDNCSIRIRSHVHNLSYEAYGFSTRIEIRPDFILSDFFDTTDVKDKRFTFHSGPKWFYKHHDLNEWIEDTPHNEPAFLLLCNQESQMKIANENITISKVYILSVEGYNLLRFEKLAPVQFDLLNRIIGGGQHIEGKIVLNGAFLGDRKKIIYKEFDYSFEFKGDLSKPQLYARTLDGSEFNLDNFQQEEDTSLKWKLPVVFNESVEFKVFEKNTNIFSHQFFTLTSIESYHPLRRNYFVKDNSGKYSKVSMERDLMDLPEKFYEAGGRNFVTYNSFQSKHLKDYRSVYNGFTNYKPKSSFDYCDSQSGNLLLKFLNTSPDINTNDFSKLIQQFGKNIDRKTAKRIMFYWRHLGYLDFEEYGQKISANYPTLFFLRTEGGLKGFITGSRSDNFIKELKEKAIETGLKIYSDTHCLNPSWIFPQMILLYDPYAMLTKFQNLARYFSLKINDGIIQYQLAALYFQSEVDSFIADLGNTTIYPYDHNRKQYFDIDSLSWRETNQRIENIQSPTLIKYDNFNDFKTILYILRHEHISYSLSEYSIGIFYLLSVHNKNILKKRIDINYVGRNCSDLLVPLFIPLPFWLERGIILSNAIIPKIELVDGKQYRVYEKIPESIIELIAKKLKQKIILL